MDGVSAEKHTGSRLSQDRLLGCVLNVVQHFGRPVSPETLTAGLPLVEGGIAIDQVPQAVHRIGFDAEIFSLPASAIRAIDLPLIAIREGGECVVLLAMEGKRRSERRVSYFDPAGATTRTELEKDFFLRCTGEYMRIVPASNFDRGAIAGEYGAAGHWFFAAFRGSRWLYGEAVLATAVINLLGLTIPLFLMIVYDRVIPNQALDTLWALSAGIAVAIVLDLLFRTLRNHFVESAARRADVQIANRIFQTVVGRRFAEPRAAVGSDANVVREYESLREFIGSFSMATIGDLPFIALYIAMIWLIAGNVALVPLGAVVLVLVAMLLMFIPLNAVTRRAFQESTERNGVLVEAFTGLETIKAMRAESWAAAKWERAVATSIRSSQSARHWMHAAMNLLSAVNGITTVAVVIVGVLLVRDGTLTGGIVIAVVILTGRALMPLSQITAILLRLNQAVTAYRALHRLMQAPQERAAGAQFIHKPRFDGAIDIKNVSFQYPGTQTRILNEVTLSVKPGERIGIIGAIGSGKTTLLRLLLGLYAPSAGAILFDGIDQQQIDPAVLRANIGYVPQAGALFDGTIRENIALHAGYAPDATIAQAAKISGAAEWITKLPGGYDTRVGERGERLSGGQRQSVALARAMVVDPPILLFDEPTSDLDAQSEFSFMGHIEAAAQRKTLILVTHRQNLLRMVDRLIVVDGGRILADGPKNDVVEALRRRRTAGQTRPAGQEGSPPNG